MKILGIGADIAKISRFSKMSVALKKRVFTENEARYCESKPLPQQHFAARFAAKEAVAKACQKALPKISPLKVEILNDENKYKKGKKENKENAENEKYEEKIASGASGAPFAKVNGLRGARVFLSLSHDGDYAVAFAVCVSD